MASNQVMRLCNYALQVTRRVSLHRRNRWGDKIRMILFRLLPLSRHFGKHHIRNESCPAIMSLCILPIKAEQNHWTHTSLSWWLDLSFHTHSDQSQHQILWQEPNSYPLGESTLCRSASAPGKVRRRAFYIYTSYLSMSRCLVSQLLWYQTEPWGFHWLR